MTDPALAETLAGIAMAMAPARDAWWIIGSAALSLHGVAPLHIGDVDIVLSVEDARIVLPRLRVAVRAGDDDGRFRSRIFGRWDTPPLAVEFMAGLAVFDGVRWGELAIASREAIDCRGGTMFVPSRAELGRILATFGRPKDLDRLRLLGS